MSYAAFFPTEAEARSACAQWAAGRRADWRIGPITEIIRCAEDTALFGPMKAKEWAAPVERPNVPDVPVRMLRVKASGEFARWPYDRYEGESWTEFTVMFPA